jgi:hypothetical protein
MPDTFYVDRHRCANLNDPILREELQRHTDSEGEVESILRSLARFGTDPSIRDFRVSPTAAGWNRRAARTAVWQVRANRI